MNNTNYASSFETLDLGTPKPTSVPVEVIEVEVSVGDLVAQYGRAFVREAFRVNPLRAEQIGITEDEITRYCDYLLTKRLEVVDGRCNDFRKLKSLYIPAYIQYVLSQIGIVNLRKVGLQLKPIAKTQSTLTFDEAILISEKVGMLIDDLQIVQDAMPRGIEGNEDVMSTAMIAGYVRSLKEVDHVSATYVTAFLEMKLKQEAAFQALYRVQYDDVNFIVSALTSQRGIY
jgi:hypothetical protein